MTAPATTAAPLPAANWVPAWAVWLLRIPALLLAIVTFLQPVFAGMFITGDVGAKDLHATGHLLILLIALFMIVAAILVWRPGRGPAWPIWASLLFVLATEAQATLGWVRMLGLHMPFGIVLFGVTVALVMGIWSPRLRVRRSKPKGEE